MNRTAEVVVDDIDGEGFAELVEGAVFGGEGMLNGGGDIALNEQVIGSADGDLLWNPPVAGIR